MGEKGDSIGKYEQAGEIKPYSELGKQPEKEWDSWGSVLVANPDGSKERRSYYTDPEIIRRMFSEPLIDHLRPKQPEPKRGLFGWRQKSQPVVEISQEPQTLVDFGGGDGIMLHNINEQITAEPGFPPINPVLIDLDRKKLESAKQQFPELAVVEGSLTQLPFADNSIDLAVSRQVLQYFSGFTNVWAFVAGLAKAEPKSELNQEVVLKEIHRVMKPVSLFDLVWTGSTVDSPEARNVSRFWNMLTVARTGQSYDEVENEREFVSGFFLTKLAAEMGFDIVKEEAIHWVEWRFTPEALFDRFDPDGKMPEEKKATIRRIFDLVVHPEDPRMGPRRDFHPGDDSIELNYIDHNGQKAIELPITRLLLRKRAPLVYRRENEPTK